MPPPSHGRRLPQRKEKRSLSRSRSSSRSQSGYRKKLEPKHKYSQSRGHYRSRSRSRSRSRTPKKHLPPKDRKPEKYLKHGRRSRTPVKHRPVNHGKGVPLTRGNDLPRRKEPYRSCTRSYSRSPSRSPSTKYGKNRKRHDFSPSDDSRSRSRSPGRGPMVHYNKETDSYTTTSRYSDHHSLHHRGSGKPGSYTDTDMRGHRYGVTNTADSSYSCPPAEAKKLLTDRFKDDSIPPVEIEENITIGIHRKLSSRAHVSNIIIREFNSMTDFKMLRRSNEGRRPMFDREEVKKFRWDDKLEDEVFPVEERRVITMSSSSKVGSDPIFTRTGSSPPRDMDYRQPRGRGWRDFDRHVGGEEDYNRRSGDDYDRREFDKPRVQPEVRLDPRPDPRYEHVYRQHEYEEKAQQMDDLKLEKIQRNPNDLRHNLLKKHDRQVEESDSAKYPVKSRRGLKEDRSQQLSRSPVRFSMSPGKGRSLSRSRSRSRSRGHSHGNSRSPERGRDKYRGRSADRSRINLSHSGDRYKSDKSYPRHRDDMTWKERVDLANKGHSHLMHSPRGRGQGFRGRGFVRGFGRGNFRPVGEHDNRDRVDYQGRGGYRGGFSFRGRGRAGRIFRGGFRGRGFHDRGGFRGRGFRPDYNKPHTYKPGFKSGGFSSSSNSHGTWKHDMYDKLENSREDDQKPSSTTENTDK
ncbi:serine/arginine repetitive matrix protein 5-like isoform X2 [Liolophura sinensis]|uniref:serine/arginine repetitive matrix protein 5-like isoform X1 n=1 Tax=Liolophura sinensis TaxID=3198878 RepID=UPI0031594B3A